MRAIAILMLSSLIGCVGYKLENIEKRISESQRLSSSTSSKGRHTHAVYNHTEPYDYMQYVSLDDPLLTINNYTVLENVFLRYGASILQIFIERGKEEGIIDNNYLQDNFIRADTSITDTRYLDVLLSSGVLIDGINDYNDTALYFSIRKQLVKRLEFLLEKGAGVDLQPSANKMFPIQRAVYSNWIEGVNLLIRYNAKLDFTVDGGMNLVDIACTYASLDILKVLVDAQVPYIKVDGKGQTPYIHASANNQPAHMEYLKGLGVDTDVCDNEGLHAVHHAVLANNEQSLEYLHVNLPSVLKKKLYVPIFNKEVTPFELAAYQNHSSLLIKFLEWGYLSEYVNICNILRNNIKVYESEREVRQGVLTAFEDKHKEMVSKATLDN